MKATLTAEMLGTALLVATVVGSGIMGVQLAEGNAAIALLANSAATGAVLYVLISVLGPISGAHFNPAVTLMIGQDRGKAAIILAQIAGGCIGVLLAHGMFEAPPVSLHVAPRTGAGQWLGEFVATFGLLFTIQLGKRLKLAGMPALVALWIVAGYWFTSSTSFANPAVTIARALTASFAGIRWMDVPAFVMAQGLGACCGFFCAEQLFRRTCDESHHLA